MNSKYPFLDLLDKQLDDAQSQALESIKNSVIAAGAGSGKTQVLATRFSWLVMTKQAKADQILTLTFTYKAAVEMYQRIYQTLLFFARSFRLCQFPHTNFRLLLFQHCPPVFKPLRNKARLFACFK